MTVTELIAELSKIEDKNQTVRIAIKTVEDTGRTCTVYANLETAQGNRLYGKDDSFDEYLELANA